MSTDPGFAGQARYRTAFRVVGALVLVAGTATFAYGEALPGVGRTVDDAKFCDSCGSALD